MTHITFYDSPVGRLLLSAEDGRLTGLWIEGQAYDRRTLRQPFVTQEDETLMQARQWMGRYFDGKAPKPDELPLAPDGTTFQCAVWDCLLCIPYGQVTTYGAIARAVSAALGTNTMAAQAVGGAVGRNPISIIVPCHRVVGASGSLTGYAGGIDKKIALLQLEGVDTAKLSVPRAGTAR